MRALNQGPDCEQNLFEKELNFANKLHDRETFEIKEHLKETKLVFDKQLIELRDIKIELEKKVRELTVKDIKLEEQIEIQET